MDEIDRLIAVSVPLNGNLVLCQPWQLRQACELFARRAALHAIRVNRTRAGQHIRYLRRKSHSRRMNANQEISTCQP